MPTKSPFIINQGFISPKICESLLDDSFVNLDGFHSQSLNFPALDPYVKQIESQIESHYDTTIKSTAVLHETYDTGVKEQPRADNSVYSKGTWYRNKDIDFTTIIFLKDSNTTSPIDTNLEVYGGKLEFPTFDFGINPESGTAVTFPAYPNFLNVFTIAKIGTNHILRLSHESDNMFLYDHSQFSGTVEDWFKHLN